MKVLLLSSYAMLRERPATTRGTCGCYGESDQVIRGFRTWFSVSEMEWNRGVCKGSSHSTEVYNDHVRGYTPGEKEFVKTYA